MVLTLENRRAGIASSGRDPVDGVGGGVGAGFDPAVAFFGGGFRRQLRLGRGCRNSLRRRFPGSAGRLSAPGDNRLRATILSAMATWQPMASIVTSAPSSCLA